MASEVVKKCARLGQIGRVEAFGEPGVNRREKALSLVAPVLLTPKACEADGGSQLKQLRRLSARDLDGSSKANFRRGRVGAQQLPFPAMQLRLNPGLACARADAERFLEEGKRALGFSHPPMHVSKHGPGVHGVQPNADFLQLVQSLGEQN
jgi:hypothetical protein